MTWSSETVNKFIVGLVTTITLAGGGVVLSNWRATEVQAKEMSAMRAETKAIKEELKEKSKRADEDHDRLVRLETKQTQIWKAVDETRSDVKSLADWIQQRRR